MTTDKPQWNCRIGRVRPKLSVVHTSWEPNYAAIEGLSETLDFLKSGEIQGILWAASFRDGRIETGFCPGFGPQHALRGAVVELLKR